MNLVPKGFVRRVLEALLLVVGISVAARFIDWLLEPVIPVVIGVLALVVVARLIFGRRWR